MNSYHFWLGSRVQASKLPINDLKFGEKKWAGGVEDQVWITGNVLSAQHMDRRTSEQLMNDILVIKHVKPSTNTQLHFTCVLLVIKPIHQAVFRLKENKQKLCSSFCELSVVSSSK